MNEAAQLAQLASSLLLPKSAATRAVEDGDVRTTGGAPMSSFVLAEPPCYDTPSDSIRDSSNEDHAHLLRAHEQTSEPS